MDVSDTTNSSSPSSGKSGELTANKPHGHPNPLPAVIGMTLLTVALASGLFYKDQTRLAPNLPDPAFTSPAPPPENGIYPSVSDAENTPVPTAVNYAPPADWEKTFLPNVSLTLCLPPHWELDQWGGIFFNRDAGYQPNITYFQELPHTSYSGREAYFQYWQSEYPQVRSLVSFQETNVSGTPVLTVFPAKKSEPKTAPDGGLAVIWPANGKFWKAGLGNWNMINTSQSAFLQDFYTAISCSFTN